MRLNKPRGKAVWLIVQHIGDVALLPKLDRFRLMVGHMNVAHTRKQVAQLLRFGMRELNELKPIGTGRVMVRDLGAGGVMWERTHGAAP